MKKKISVILGIILMSIVILGIITNYADSGRVTTGHEPKYCIKIVSDDGSKVTYYGLGYKVIRYVEISPNEPYENNIGTKMGNWFINYDLPKADIIEIEYEGQKITITDAKEVGIIKNILLNSKYNNEICQGINTYKIRLNSDIYYIKEDCKEIQKGDKQAIISIDDLNTINNIIFNKMDNIQSEEEQFFYVKIIEATDSYIIVEPNEGDEIRKTADKISIALGKNNDTIYMVGTNLKVTYNGTIMETYPAQVEEKGIDSNSSINYYVFIICNNRLY